MRRGLGERGREPVTPHFKGKKNPSQLQPQILNGSPDKTAIHGAWSARPAIGGSVPLAAAGTAGAGERRHQQAGALPPAPPFHLGSPGSLPIRWL